MPDSEFVEGIKLVGGFLGIGTAIFTIWDRLFRHRPWAQPVAMMTDEGPLVSLDYPMNTSAFIQIVNQSGKDLIVVNIGSIPPIGISVIFHSSTYGVVSLKTSARREAVVPSGKSRNLEVLYDHERVASDLEKRFWVWIHWKPAGAFLPRVPLVFRTSLKEIEGYRQDAFELRRAQDKGNRH